MTTNELVYSSYIGGSGSDKISAIDIMDNQQVLLVARTGSIDFPVTANALQSSNNGGVDLAVLILDESLINIQYSTYLGGSKHEVRLSGKCVSKNKLLLTFTSMSPDFPVTDNYAVANSTNMNVLVKMDLSSN